MENTYLNTVPVNIPRNNLPLDNDSLILPAYAESLAHWLTKENTITWQDAVIFCNGFLEKTAAPLQLVYTPGRLINYVYFVHQGCFRLFHTRADGTEQTLSFHEEGEWIIDLYSFIDQQPTQLHLQAVATGILLTMNRTYFNRAMKQFTWYKPLHQQLISQHLADMQQHIRQLQTQGAGACYQQLLASRPALMQQLPAHFLATYLGITVDGLSRIKAEGAT